MSRAPLSFSSAEFIAALNATTGNQSGVNNITRLNTSFAFQDMLNELSSKWIQPLTFLARAYEGSLSEQALSESQADNWDALRARLISFMSNDVASARMSSTQSIRSDAGHLFTTNSDEGFPRVIHEDSFLAASVESRTPAVGASLARRPSAAPVPGRFDIFQSGRGATVLTNAGPGFFTTPHTAQDSFFPTANSYSVRFSAEFANWLNDFTTEEEGIDDEVPTTPELFAATCQAIETAPRGHHAWNDFGRQKSDILFENQKPWDFLGDCATEAMKKSLLLRSVLGPVEHLPLPARLPDGDLPPSSFSPEHMAEFGPALIETAYKLHLEFSFRKPCQTGMIMRGLYRDLTTADVNIPEYLDYWVNQPNVMPGVSASFLAGLGVFRILAEFSGKSESAFMKELRAQHRSPRPSHIRFAESLPQVGQPCADRDVCPICLENLDNIDENADSVPVVTPCGHTLMRDCLGRALEGRDLACPMCRQDMVALQFKIAMGSSPFKL